MYKIIIKPIFTLLVIAVFLTGCKNDNFNIKEEQLANFHIKSISNELEIVSKAFSQLIQNERNVLLIKDAIYKKKKDENITFKDLFTYLNSTGSSTSRTSNFEEQLLDEINNYQAMNLDEFRSLIDLYDLSIYWEYIQLWDGTTQPKVGYPINEEEDVNNDYDLMSYKIFTSIDDVVGTEVVESYIYENPVILVRPLEDFENGSEIYYGDDEYVWLGDAEMLKYIDLEPLSNPSFKTQNVNAEDRCRVFSINTNGNRFDGSGGPEFRFFRNGIFNFSSGLYGFSEIIYLNLTSSAATTTNWISLTQTNNILHDLWTFFNWNQLIGTYEQDGGVGTNNVDGIVAEGTLDALGIEVFKLQLSATTKIQRKDDLIDKYQMSWNSFLFNVKQRNNWGWGFYNDNGVNRPIRATDHPDLKIVYKNY